VLTTIAATLASTPQPALPGFLEALASPLEHYGLWGVFFLVMVEDFGIPVPGETVIIAASIYAGSGRLNVVAVGVVAFVAAVFGDNIGYGIGRFGGRRLVDRWGKYVFLTPERLDKAEEFFDRQGAKIITIARFIEGLRQANGIIAGITKMHWARFIAYNALGAALWVGTWVSVGYFAGQHINTIYSLVTRYSLYVAIAAVVVIVALIVRHVLRKRRATVRGTVPEASGGAGAVDGAGGAGAVDGAGGAGGAGAVGGAGGAGAVGGAGGAGAVDGAGAAEDAGGAGADDRADAGAVDGAGSAEDASGAGAAEDAGVADGVRAADGAGEGTDAHAADAVDGDAVGGPDDAVESAEIVDGTDDGAVDAAQVNSDAGRAGYAESELSEAGQEIRATTTDDANGHTGNSDTADGGGRPESSPPRRSSS
jgi:membrane protein DedA with SNARE-associated domain